MGILRSIPNNIELAVRGKQLIPVTQKTTAEKARAVCITCAAAFSAAAALFLYYRYSFLQRHYTTLMRAGDLPIGGILIPVILVCAVVHHLAHGSLRMREHAVFYAYLLIPVALVLVVHYGLVPLMSHFFLLRILAFVLELAVPLLAATIIAFFTWNLIENQSFPETTRRTTR